MFRSNLSLIFRQLKSVYSLINLAGLTVGFSAFILIYLWVNEELSYDRFHTDYQKIFRVVGNEVQEKGDLLPVAITSAPLADYLTSTFGEIENACRLRSTEFFIRYEDGGFYQVGLAADPSFFKVFTFPLIKGSVAGLEEATDKIVITRKMANSYFGEADPIGKMFLIAGRDVMVTGVIENIPANSHLQFDYILPIKFLEEAGIDELINWDYLQLYTYIKTKGNDEASLNEKIKNVVKKNSPKSTMELTLQPLTDIYLKSTHLSSDMNGRGNIQYVYVFSLIALFILIVASINYSNLATARSIRRSKETGVRKVMGASRSQLAIFFFSESMLYSIVALMAGLLVSWLLLPSFNELSGKQLAFEFYSLPILGSLVVSALMCAVIGGIYPALILSGQNPVIAFKGMAKSGAQAITIRRVLVGVQFILSIGLLTGAFIIQDQMDYIQTRDLGYEKENVISFTALRKVRAQYDVFKNELLKLPEVKFVTAHNESMSAVDYWTDEVEWEGKNPNAPIRFYQLTVDHDFLKTYSIELAEGRDFSVTNVSDTLSIILNEKAVADMGLKDPLNKTVRLHDKNYSIIGIVKDFNFKSVHTPIAPLMLYIDPSNYFQFSVKLSKGPLAEHVKAVEGIAKKFAPERPFDYTFVDDNVNKLYVTESRTGTIFKYFSGLAIFISSLGLFGIILFITEQRAREMAIRKTLGAPVYHLMALLSWEYLILILIAFCVASGGMFYMMNKWLGNFAYHIDLTTWIFIKAGLIILLFAWLTIAYRTFRAATSNPVDSLRSE